jgi:DNA polymerase III delta prime subunit
VGELDGLFNALAGRSGILEGSGCAMIALPDTDIAMDRTTETEPNREPDSMTVEQLRAACRAAGIREAGVGSARREVLIESLKAGRYTGKAITAPTPSTDFASAMVAEVARIAGSIQQAIPEDRIREIAREEAGDLREYVESKLSEQAPSPVITVRVAELPEVQLPRQHWKFPLLLACAANGIPAYLVGERGSGKTTVGHAIARALGREFGSMSLGPATSKSDLIGFIGATGGYCKPELVRMAESGGVYLLDELDLCHPGSLAQANAILANGQFGTPGGMVMKSDKFYPIAGGNTFGHGATTSYKGRQGLDGATLDRFAVISWEYDGNLERIAAGLPANKASEVAFDLADGGVPTVEQWVKVVQSVRKEAMAKSLITFPSPRASEYGAKLARAGVGYRWLREMFITRGFENMEQITPKSL